MNNETKFMPKHLDEELVKAGMLERMRDIIEFAIDNELTAREALEIINREIELIKDVVKLDNKIARDKFVRRELGLNETDIIRPQDYLCLFNPFDNRRFEQKDCPDASSGQSQHSGGKNQPL
ncbi:TPA: hypothetical protein ACG0DI_003422 [Escherichia coli]